jgi:hypothetical protein
MKHPSMRLGFATLLLGAVLALSASAQNAARPAAGSAQTLRFSSGFECGDEVSPQLGTQRARLVAGRACSGQDWNRDLPSRRLLGRAALAYEAGDDSERFARVIADPVAPENHVLQFWLGAPHIGVRGPRAKGRVQLDIGPMGDGAQEIREAVRMYLPADFAHVKDYPKPIGWLTIAEWWNNSPAPMERYPFRITVDIVKEQLRAGSPLNFRARAETYTRDGDRWTRVWSADNTSYDIPLERWLGVEYQFVEGDAESGRFRMTVQGAAGERVTIFDIRNFTRHPDDPAPDGVKNFNPIKLYTSGPVIEHVRARGGVLQILWDDLTLCAGDRGSPLGPDCDNLIDALPKAVRK